MRRLVLAVSTIMLLAGDAAAWHPIPSFDKTPNEGGGGGVRFTGSPRYKGYDCSMCHIDGDRTVSVDIGSEPAELAAGRYTPGVTYTIQVRMLGEHRGGASVANVNTFLADIADDSGAPIAGFDVDEDVLRLAAEGTVVATRAVGNSSEWSFQWTAPAAGRGPLTLYLGLVDGDGAGDAVVGRTDPVGDDVAVVTARWCESSASCPAPGLPERPESSAQCATALPRRGSPATSLWLAVFAIVALGRRRIRGAVPTVAVLALVASSAACFDPKVPAECPDRVCGDAGFAIIDAGGDDECLESWECTSWEAPLGSDEATRTCVDRNSRGTTECKPDEGPATLPALDMEFFKCRVMPVFQRGCAMMGCHGVEEGRALRIYARGRLRNNQVVDRTGSCIPATGQVNLQEAGTGTVMCEGWLPHTDEEWKKNFDSARSFMLGVSNVRDSELMSQAVVGGKPHVEVYLYRETDADYLTLRAWLQGESLGTTCATGPN